MKWFGKAFLSALLVIAGVSALAYFFLNKPTISELIHKKIPVATSANAARNDHKVTFAKLHEKRDGVKTFATKNHYNTEVCFMIDMSIASGTQRFFVYNLQKDSVELMGLVAHGQGSSRNGIEFSNEPGSYCTSLGKYKIGGVYNGKFGLAYKLHGLDNTNSKALERFVVLHAHECVPNEPVTPLGICQSQGCPTVSPEFLQKLAKYINASSKPVLLMIYN